MSCQLLSADAVKFNTDPWNEAEQESKETEPVKPIFVPQAQESFSFLAKVHLAISALTGLFVLLSLILSARHHSGSIFNELDELKKAVDELRKIQADAVDKVHSNALFLNSLNEKSDETLNEILKSREIVSGMFAIVNETQRRVGITGEKLSGIKDRVENAGLGIDGLQKSQADMIDKVNSNALLLNSLDERSDETLNEILESREIISGMFAIVNETHRRTGLTNEQMHVIMQRVQHVMLTLQSLANKKASPENRDDRIPEQNRALIAGFSRTLGEIRRMMNDVCVKSDLAEETRLIGDRFERVTDEMLLHEKMDNLTLELKTHVGETAENVTGAFIDHLNGEEIVTVVSAAVENVEAAISGLISKVDSLVLTGEGQAELFNWTIDEVNARSGSNFDALSGELLEMKEDLLNAVDEILVNATVNEQMEALQGVIVDKCGQRGQDIK